MHLTSKEAVRLCEGMINNILPNKDVEIVVCPSFTLLWPTQQTIGKSSMRLGAQNCFWKEEGAFTGEISPKMLLDSGVQYCIVGHSETRGRFGKLDIPESTTSYFSESDETISLKIKSLFDHYIYPILCVGETIDERKAGKTDEVIENQIKQALAHAPESELNDLVIAYEPVWAIGTGETCEPEEAERVCAFIRKSVAKFANDDAAAHIRILYGGSVKPENSKKIFEQPNIDGGLVGGASLNAKDFADIATNL